MHCINLLSFFLSGHHAGGVRHRVRTVSGGTADICGNVHSKLLGGRHVFDGTLCVARARLGSFSTYHFFTLDRHNCFLLVSKNKLSIHGSS